MLSGEAVKGNTLGNVRSCENYVKICYSYIIKRYKFTSINYRE
jgi:hypothetical protein